MHIYAYYCHPNPSTLNNNVLRSCLLVVNRFIGGHSVLKNYRDLTTRNTRILVWCIVIFWQKNIYTGEKDNR